MQPHAGYSRDAIDRRSSRFIGADDRCMIPFDRREGVCIEETAATAGKSVRTMRLWCEQHHIGGRVAGGPWVISRAALQMLLDGNNAALRAYLAGDRSSPLVVEYFERAGLGQLVRAWCRDAASVQHDF